MKKAFVSVLFILSLFVIFVSAKAEEDKAGASTFVTINCKGDTIPIIDNPEARICLTKTVTFKFIPSCDSVKLKGDSPIDSCWLSPANPQKVVTFTNLGIYHYWVTDLAAVDTAYGVVNVLASYCTPTLTDWGIIILIGLIISSAVFILLRRRKATVSA